jgi:hypothetical protein
MNETIGPEFLWGAPAIARAANLSCTAVRRLAKDPRTPFFKPPGSNRLFVTRTKLNAWLHKKQQDTSQNDSLA